VTNETAKKYVSDILCVLGLLLLGFISALDLRSQQQEGDQGSKSLPRFEDFSVGEAWKGPPAPVKFTSHGERMFRTAIQEAAKQQPDFAGHYRFAIWGCGTRCAGGAIIDLSTGAVFSPPLGGKGTREDYWIFCTDWDKRDGAEYHVNSRLLILRCGHEYNEHADDVHYLVWDQDHFREVLHTAGTEP
jgi:hypothetical protein